MNIKEYQYEDHRHILGQWYGTPNRPQTLEDGKLFLLHCDPEQDAIQIHLRDLDYILLDYWSTDLGMELSDSLNNQTFGVWFPGETRVAYPTFEQVWTAVQKRYPNVTPQDFEFAG